MKQSWPYIALVLAVLYIVYQLYNPKVVTQTKIETVVDTTSVDSLRKVVQYYKDLPPVVIRDTLEIPVPVIDNGRYTYRFPYRDSLLVAAFTATLMGEVEFSSASFEYTLKRRQLVVEDTRTITLTKTVTTTITKTLQPVEKGYLFVGGEAGLQNTSIIGGWVTPKKYHIHYRYNIFNGSHNVGIAIPLKL